MVLVLVFKYIVVVLVASLLHNQSLQDFSAASFWSCLAVKQRDRKRKLLINKASITLKGLAVPCCTWCVVLFRKSRCDLTRRASAW